jgi:hypothetical protein
LREDGQHFLNPLLGYNGGKAQKQHTPKMQLLGKQNAILFWKAMTMMTVLPNLWRLFLVLALPPSALLLGATLSSDPDFPLPLDEARPRSCHQWPSDLK